jgi:mRNA interferase MazF
MAEPTPRFEPGSVLIRGANRDSGDGKLRPCVVISSSAREEHSTADSVLVVPLSSDTDGRQRLPMPVIHPDPGNGLLKPSAALCGRLRCTRTTRLNQRLGSLSAQELRRVRLGVAAVIGLADLPVQPPPS